MLLHINQVDFLTKINGTRQKEGLASTGIKRIAFGIYIKQVPSGIFTKDSLINQFHMRYQYTS